MPWTADDADQHIKGLTDTQKSAWAKIANSALAACQKKGDSDCEGSAIRIANAGAKKVGKLSDALRTVGFAQLVKFNADTGQFEATMASSTPDKVDEVLDYPSSKPFFKAWISETQKRSKGKSLGNVREMHQPSAVGRLTAVTFDDAQERIHVKGVIDDPAARHKAAVGVYTGVSIGGSYTKTWSDGPYLRYTAKIAELSLVDNPCNPDAVLELVKGGVASEVDFVAGDTIRTPFEEDADLWKAEGDRPNDKSGYAYTPGDNKSEWKFPIHDAAHVRNALARFNQADLPADAKAKVYAKIKAAAKKFGVEVGEPSDSEAAKLAKCDYPVDQLGEVVRSLRWACDMAQSDAARADCEELYTHAMRVLATGAAAEAAEGDGNGDPDGGLPVDDPGLPGAYVEKLMAEQAKQNPTLVDIIKAASKEEKKEIRKALGVNGKKMRKAVADVFDEKINSEAFGKGLAKLFVAAIAATTEKPKGAAMSKVAAPDATKTGTATTDDDERPLIMPDGTKFSAEVRQELEKAMAGANTAPDPSRLGFRDK